MYDYHKCSNMDWRLGDLSLSSFLYFSLAPISFSFPFSLTFSLILSQTQTVCFTLNQKA